MLTQGAPLRHQPGGQQGREQRQLGPLAQQPPAGRGAQSPEQQAQGPVGGEMKDLAREIHPRPEGHRAHPMQGRGQGR